MKCQAGHLSLYLQAFIYLTTQIKIKNVLKHLLEDLEAKNRSSLPEQSDEAFLFFQRAAPNGAGQKPYRGSSFRETSLPLLVIKSHGNATHRSPGSAD